MPARLSLLGLAVAATVTVSAANALAQTAGADTPEPAVSKGRFHYPQTAKTDHVDDYHGVKVADGSD